MFVYDEDLIDVKIHFKKRGHNYLAYTSSEFEDLGLKDEEKKEYSEVNIKMKELTFSLYNELQEDAMVETSSGEHRFNFKIFKENKLKKLIKEWDAKGKEDKPVAINENSISHLSPQIAEAISESNTRLKGLGRILVRYSGTEPLARVMVEGKDNNLIQEIADYVAGKIKQEIGETAHS